MENCRRRWDKIGVVLQVPVHHVVSSLLPRRTILAHRQNVLVYF